MITSFKRKGAIVASIAIGIALMAAAHPQPQDHQFHNLKVLPKDISHEQLDAVMDHFKVSLGVRCGYCHAPSADDSKHLDFASDAKEEKNIAREMMKMTHDLNTKYFNYMKSSMPDTIHTITCYTCHRGSTEPVSIAPMGEHNDHHMPPPMPGHDGMQPGEGQGPDHNMPH